MSDAPKVITPYLSENLEGLRDEEERIRTSSALAINAEVSLRDHVEIIHECVDMLMWHARRQQPTLIEDQIIYGLGVRIFNSGCCLLKLLLAGYYQGAVSFLRDLVEMGFLLDYFSIDHASILVWRNSTDKKEREQFKPWKIRDALDKRDSFQTKRRGDMYALLSTYGTHASFDGFKLSIEDERFSIGPFFSEKKLCGVLEETAKHFPSIVLSCMKFDHGLQLDDLKQKLLFFESVETWWKKYMNADFISSDLKELKELMSRL